MRDREALDVLTQIRADTHEITRDLKPARARAHDHAGLGYPAGGGQGTHGCSTDPVLAATLATLDLEARGVTPDIAALELAEYELRLERMRLDAAWLVTFGHRYTRPPATGQARPTCRLCATDGKGTPGETKPVYAKERCRRHYDFWLEYHDDMHPDLTRCYCEGRRLTPSMIAEHHTRPTQDACTAHANG